MFHDKAKRTQQGNLLQHLHTLHLLLDGKVRTSDVQTIFFQPRIRQILNTENNTPHLKKVDGVFQVGDN